MEDPRVSNTQAWNGLNREPQRVLAGAIQRRRRARRVHFIAVAAVYSVLGTGAGRDDSPAAAFCKGLNQLQAAVEPANVFRRIPELAMFGDPSEMQQVRRSDRRN